MSAFISYARVDRSIVESIRHDLERSNCPVWLDDELRGGQAWWDTILEQIRTCDLFVFALSPDSLRSKPCQAELRYAVALGRPLLPVMVRAVSVQLAPPVIADTQIIDYTERTADNAIALVTAAGRRPTAPPLPNPLPAPPAPPFMYMNAYREQIEAIDLAYRDQAQLVLALGGHLQDEDEREIARQLLVDLRARRDIAESVARDVDELLAGLPPATALPSNAATWTAPTPSARSTPDGPSSASARPAAAGARHGSPAWYPDPTGRHQQRYWDGSRWTDHVASGGQQQIDPVEPAASRGISPRAAPDAVPSAGSTAVAPFSSGAYVALIVAAVLVGIVGVIVGALNLKHPARRSQAQVLLGIGIANIVVSFLLVGG